MPVVQECFPDAPALLEEKLKLVGQLLPCFLPNSITAGFFSDGDAGGKLPGCWSSGGVVPHQLWQAGIERHIHGFIAEADALAVWDAARIVAGNHGLNFPVSRQWHERWLKNPDKALESLTEEMRNLCGMLEMSRDDFLDELDDAHGYMRAGLHPEYRDFAFLFSCSALPDGALSCEAALQAHIPERGPDFRHGVAAMSEITFPFPKSEVQLAECIDKTLQAAFPKLDFGSNPKPIPRIKP